MMNTTIYEVNVRQYTPEGTFNAFLPALPRLRDMGVETLWFMPVTPIAQKLKKGQLGSYYAAADYTSINPEFGTMDDFRHLVKEAQSQGFKVIIDWVANHTGWDHVWTVEHPGYYKIDASTGDFLRASGMDDIIELDYTNPALRKAMIEAMRFWIVETGIDGFRCDLAFWVELPFWIEAKAELEKDKKLFWLGELDPLDHPDYMQVFTAAYSWTWMHRTEEFYKNHLPLSALTEVLDRYRQVPPMQAWFTSNHDENSWNGSEYEKYGEGAKALAVFSCTWPGLPLIYSGQELPNKKRLAFFEKDLIGWNGNYELHGFYKLLLDLHKHHPALHGSEQEAPLHLVRTSTPAHVLAYLRKKEENEVLVFLNLSRNEVHPIIGEDALKGKFENLFDKSVVDFDETKELYLKPWDYLVFVK
jgi:glycosidase